jgi:hypothetical protein
MEKIDLQKQYKHLYAPSPKAPVIVDVPAFNFLMIDGHGDPNTSADYQQVVSALFTCAYTLKFDIKKKQGIDYAVMPLEGLWWAEDMAVFTATSDKSSWDWTMMMVQPECVTVKAFNEVAPQAAKKIGAELLSRLRFESYLEGPAVQIMHVGPYSAEGPNIARMHDFAQEQDFALVRKHHEIYLSDVRRTAPESLKTVLRQPIHTRQTPVGGVEAPGFGSLKP